MASVQVAQGAVRTARAGGALARVLQGKDFSLLWIGQGLSGLGDQFFMVALPWLVLQMTGDALALGAVLALSGIPRALLMLLGGAITDRISPRVIMLASDIARLILTGLMAVLVLTGHIEMWMLYVGALAFGIVAGFFGPASTSIVPRLVGKDDLQMANALSQGTAQLTVLVGPALAGAMIAAFAHTIQGTASVKGVGIALAIDAASFLASVITLQLMTLKQDREQAANVSVLRAIQEGMTYVWRDATLRVVIVMVAAINFLFTGPLVVGIPVLANTRLPGGAAAYGIVMSALGGGTILGFLIAGALPKPKRMSILFIGANAFFGVALIGFGFIRSTWLAAGSLFALGVADGYLGIQAITWLQRRTPGHMMGRIMSLLLFAGVALVPVSQAISGAVLRVTMTGLFVGAGVLLILLALRALLTPAVRNVQM